MNVIRQMRLFIVDVTDSYMILKGITIEINEHTHKTEKTGGDKFSGELLSAVCGTSRRLQQCGKVRLLSLTENLHVRCLSHLEFNTNQYLTLFYCSSPGSSDPVGLYSRYRSRFR